MLLKLSPFVTQYLGLDFGGLDHPLIPERGATAAHSVPREAGPDADVAISVPFNALLSVNL